MVDGGFNPLLDDGFDGEDVGFGSLFGDGVVDGDGDGVSGGFNPFLVDEGVGDFGSGVGDAGVGSGVVGGDSRNVVSVGGVGVGASGLESDFVGSSVSVEEVGGSGGVLDGSFVGGVPARNFSAVGVKNRVNRNEFEFFRSVGLSRNFLRSDDEVVREISGGSAIGSKGRAILDLALGDLRVGSGSAVTGQDYQVLEFLAKFKYASDVQVMRMFANTSVDSAVKRLRKLQKFGFVECRKIFGSRPLYYLTKAGMLVSGFDLVRVTEAKFTFSMFPHQFTVNNTAANLWGANVNVLNLRDFPARNRRDSRGRLIFGEELVSELELQSSFGKVRSFDKSSVYLPELLFNVDEQFARWESDFGGLSVEDGGGFSPEFEIGNEYMWVVVPPVGSGGVVYHVPDLVVKRPRNVDGSPESIAVEVEINNKSEDDYVRTLEAYYSDKRLYKKVVWVCKDLGPARKLENVAKRIGLWQEGRISIVPILTENGVFKGRDLWTI